MNQLEEKIKASMISIHQKQKRVITHILKVKSPDFTGNLSNKMGGNCCQERENITVDPKYLDGVNRKV